MFPLHDDNPTTRLAVCTYAIIVINVAILIYMAALPPVPRQVFVFEYGFVPARIAQLTSGEPLEVRIDQDRRDPATGAPVRVEQAFSLQPAPRNVIGTLFTAMFLHGGWFHLIGNMWFLAIFGNNVEDRLGHLPFVGFYFLGGLLAMAGQWVQEPNSQSPIIGASGAVAAVLGAYAVTYPHARVRTLVFLVVLITFWDLPAWAVLGFWFIGQVLSANADRLAEVHQNVAFAAHVVGFGCGALLMLVSRQLIPPPPPPTTVSPLPS